jgi:hypothetical protein
VTRKRKSSAGQPRQVASGPSSALALRGLRSAQAIVASLFPPGIVLYVALFAWYLWAVVDLRLVFHARDALFLWNVRYFTDFLGQPGALLEWANHLLVQLCYNGWPGAIATAATVWLLLISTVGLMNALGRFRSGGTWVIPGVLLVSLYGSYHFPTSAVVGLTVAVTAANVWCRMPTWRPGLRLLLFVAVSIILYYVVGPAYYCFAACCAIDEALVKRRRLWGVSFLLAAAAVKFGLDAVLSQFNLASHNFHVYSLDRRQPPPFDWRVLACYLYFPLCALFVVFRLRILSLAAAPWRRLRRGREELQPRASAESGGGDLGGDGGRGRRTTRTAALRGIRWTAGTVVALLLAAAAGFCSFNRVDKLILGIDYCAERERWGELLTNAQALPPNAQSRTVNHDINRALYHEGLLPYKLLCCSQAHPAAMTVAGGVADPVWLGKAFGLLLELGRINEAERMAFELIEVRPTGATLKNLALIKLAKRQAAAARPMLNVLRDDLIWGRWAEDRLRCLEQDPELLGDEAIQRIRGLMLVKDDLHLTVTPDSGQIVVNPDAMLLGLLKRNRENRMAFEYLMTIRLLNDNVQGVVELFPFLDDFCYSRTPPIYEEAALLYLDSHRDEGTPVGAEIFLRGRRISAASVSKFERLQAIAKTFGGCNEKARPTIARDLGDTYFYYFFYTSRKSP